MPTLEVHVPISPNEHFFTMLHYLLESFRQNAGEVYSNTRFVVTVGADGPPYDLAEALPWTSDYPLTWQWLDRELFRDDSYYATAVERFVYPFMADVVMLMDVDVLITGPLDELVQTTWKTGRFAGLVAHASPFVWHREVPNQVWWERLFHAANLTVPPFEYEHPYWNKVFDDPTYRYAPPYLNLGVLIAPRDLMSRVGSTIYSDMKVVDQVLSTHFKCQLATALSLRRHRVPTQPLELKYNFPCTIAIEDLNPISLAEIADLRVCHYLGQGEIDKSIDFASPAAVQKMLLRDDLNEVLTFFQRKLQVVHSHLERYYPDEFVKGRELFQEEQAAKRQKEYMRQAIADNNFAAALPLLTELVAAEPGRGEWRYLQGFGLHMLKQDLAQALECYNRALACGYDEFWVRYNRGILLRELGDLSAARKDLERAVTVNSNHAGAELVLAQILEQEKKSN